MTSNYISFLGGIFITRGDLWGMGVQCRALQIGVCTIKSAPSLVSGLVSFHLPMFGRGACMNGEGQIFESLCE